MDKEIGKAKSIDEWIVHVRGKPIEEAIFINYLIEELGYTPQEVHNSLELSRGVISRRLKLLTLSPKLIKRIQNGEIKPRTAYYISKLPKNQQTNYETQEKVTLKEIHSKVRETLMSEAFKDLLNEPIIIEKEEKLDSSFSVLEHAKELIESLCNLVENEPEILSDIRSEAHSLREIFFEYIISSGKEEEVI